MMSDEWLAIDKSGHVTEIVSAPETNESPEKLQRVVSLNSQRNSDERAAQRRASHSSALRNATPIVGDAVHAESPYAEVNELQQMGKEFYEANYAALHNTVTNFFESATSTSYSALGKLRSELHRALAGFAETDTSGNEWTTAAGANGSDEQLSIELTEAEIVAARHLLPLLVKADKARFSGRDFRTWFRTVRPIFEETLPNESTLYLSGVKLYSQPPIAALIDDLDFEPLVSWEQMETVIDEYFQKYYAKTRKYQTVCARTCK